MYLSIIFLPLIGSIISGFFGRKVGVKGAQIITCVCVITTSILSIISFLEVGINNTPVYIELFK
jgi:NADH-ubiquinone oxidoreductase chain 5